MKIFPVSFETADVIPPLLLLELAEDLTGDGGWQRSVSLESARACIA